MGDFNGACLRMYDAVLECSEVVTPKDAQERARSLFKDFFVVISPDAYYAIESIEKYVRSTRMSVKMLNATLYRSFEDVLTRTPLELLIDQFLQYLTINWHGATGVAYVPADFCDLELEIPEKGLELFYVGVLRREDLASKCKSLLTGGTALSSQTVKDTLLILEDLNEAIDAEKVKNREAKSILIYNDIKSGTAERYRADEVIRATVYGSTKETLLIKNEKLIQLIISSEHDVSTLFESYGVTKLATVFNRYKYLFMAYKMANLNNKPVINLISRMSKSRHRPLPQNPLNAVSHRVLDLQTDENWLRNATVSALLRALNVCRSYIHPQKHSRYLVRNGTCWAVARELGAREAAKTNYEILMKRVISLLKSKFEGKSVYVPKEVEYGLPISEKQVLGAIPFGTKITVPATESIAVGLHWKLEDGGQIMDLSGTTTSGRHIAWNSEFKAESFVHSGDNCAVKDDVGATEYILAQKGSPRKDEELVVFVNCWSGWQAHSFQIIVGRGDEVTEQYMMNPSNLIVNGRFQASVRMTALGIIKRTSDSTTIILAPSSLSNAHSSNDINADIRTSMREATSHTINCALTLNELLENVGATIVNELPDQADFDLSLNKINKDFFNLILE